MRKRYEAVKVRPATEVDPATGLDAREIEPPADRAWYCCSRITGEVFYGSTAAEAEKRAKKNDKQIADSRAVL